ncbi:hypothetical protein AAG663_09900 [Bacillus licheniformis]
MDVAVAYGWQLKTYIQIFQKHGGKRNEKSDFRVFFVCGAPGSSSFAAAAGDGQLTSEQKELLEAKTEYVQSLPEQASVQSGVTAYAGKRLTIKRGSFLAWSKRLYRLVLQRQKSIEKQRIAGCRLRLSECGEGKGD